MNHDEFAMHEFISLREEIRETKARIFRTVVAGLTVVPAANAVAEHYEIGVLVVSLPILVLVVGLLYLSEFHGLMRCGRYIREHVEPRFQIGLGWEQWLATPDETRKRTVDLYIFVSFNLLYMVYFAGGAVLAVQYVLGHYGQLPALIAALVYTVLFVWSSVFMIRNWKTLTTTGGEWKPPNKPLQTTGGGQPEGGSRSMGSAARG